MNQNAIARAAALLAQARKTSSALPALPPECQPQSVAEAHAIQDAVTALLAEPVAGFKASAPAGGEPKPGRPKPDEGVRGLIYLANTYPNGSTFPVEQAPQCGVEGEVAFRFRHDLPPRPTPYTREEVAAAVDACAAIEVVSSRFAEPGAAPYFDRLADRISNGGFIPGTPVGDWQKLDLGTLPVTLTVNGVVQVQQRGGHPTSDPLGVAAVLVELMRGTVGVRAGQYVTCGSYTGLPYFKAGDHCRVEFEGLGVVEMRFSA